LTVATQLVGGLFCLSLFVDDYHFMSDVLWGASMGWAVGEWVVRHRSTRYISNAGVPIRVLPIIDVKRSGAALTVAVAF
jgi:hypothetical protein